ncbi:MAG: hypothetical protein WCN98_17635, partial [Verrucomicrobiaceae bacterium]
AATALYGAVADYLPEAEPAFRKTDSVLLQLEKTLHQLQNGIAQGQEGIGLAQDFLSQIQTAITTALGQSNGIIFQQINGEIAAIVAAAPVPQLTFANSAQVKAELKQKIKLKIREQLGTSLLVSNLQGVFKQELGAPSQQIHGVFDLLMAKIEDGIRRLALPNGLMAAIDRANSMTEAAGKLKDVVKAAGLSGNATFNGPSITHLRLDGNLALSIPDDLAFHGWLEFNDYARSSPQKGCIPAGVMGASIEIGADAEVNMPGLSGSRLKLGEKAFVALYRNNNGLVYPIGFFGETHLSGAMQTGSVELNQLDFNAAFGVNPSGVGSPLADAYLACKAKGTVGPFVGDVAVFLGRACQLQQLKVFDPDVVSALDNSSHNNPVQAFNGFYIRFGGDVNLSQVFEVPQSLLAVSGSRHEGYFGFINDNGSLTGGAFLDYGLKGTILSTASLDTRFKVLAFASSDLLSEGNLISGLFKSRVCLKATGEAKACVYDDYGCVSATVTLDGELRAVPPVLGLRLRVPIIKDLTYPPFFQFTCP